MSKNIDDEDFDKDIELAKLQVEAAIWASVLSVHLGVAFAIIAGAVLALIAYLYATPNPTITMFTIEAWFSRRLPKFWDFSSYVRLTKAIDRNMRNGKQNSNASPRE